MVHGQPHPTEIPDRRPVAAAHRIGPRLALVIGAVIIVRLGRKRFLRVRVAGDSMLPAFRAGDRLLIGPRVWLRPGAVVAVEDPRCPGRLMVKRVHAVGPTWVDVRGDNQPASTDSRQFGPVPRSRLAGRIVYRYGPAGRTGWWPGQARRPASTMAAHAIGPGD
jgi:nickel-type superoxide dismutase maturation protease